MGQTYPEPITALMVHPANPNCAKPAYWGPGVATDWHNGDNGNDVDVASACQSIANSCSARIENDYEPQHQEEKGANMVPPLEVLGDIGKDYGAFSGQPYREGYIEPLMPYGPPPEPEP